MTDAPDAPLGEAGARLRALVAQMRTYADEIHYRDAARIREWVTELEALLSAPVVSPPLEHAAKLLALSLTDEMLDSLRADYGHTNVAVLRHWKAEVLSLSAPVVSPWESAIEAEITQQEAYALLPASYAWPSMTPDHHRHVASILKLVLAHLRQSATVVSGWQPIETAPEATWVLVFVPNYGMNIATMTRDPNIIGPNGAYWFIRGDDDPCCPTLWTHLPPLPAPVVTQEGEEPCP